MITTRPCNIDPERSAPKARASSSRLRPIPAASQTSPAGTAPKAAKVTRIAPIASASSARLRAITPLPVSAIIPQ